MLRNRTIRATDETWKNLKIIAATRGLNISELINYWVDKELANKGKEEPV